MMIASDQDGGNSDILVNEIKTETKTNTFLLT
jgi:hypothetical protein